MLKLGDCLDHLKNIENNSVDLIITSPPYEDVNGAGYTAKSKDVLFLKLYSEFLDKVFKEYKRVISAKLEEKIKEKIALCDRKISALRWE